MLQQITKNKKSQIMYNMLCCTYNDILTQYGNKSTSHTVKSDKIINMKTSNSYNV